MARSIARRRSVDLMTWRDISSHYTTLRATDTALGCSHANLMLLLTTRFTTSIRSQREVAVHGQIDSMPAQRRSNDAA